MTLSEAWDKQANAWIDFARDPLSDAPFWSYNLPAFLKVLPPPGNRTIDIGCGEGRLSRSLTALGHQVVGVEISQRLAEAVRTHEQPAPVVVGDAVTLPFADGSFDLALLFMVLHDLDNMERSVAEAARVVSPGGRVCLAILHPLQGIGDFSGDDRQGPYVLERSYFVEQRLTYRSDRNGAEIAFHFRYRPLAAYTSALEKAGLLIESLREPAPPEQARQALSDFDQRLLVPSFLHIRAIRV